MERRTAGSKDYRVYLTYFDDSESHDKKLQCVGAVILHDTAFNSLENFLGATIEELVPEDLRESFEFHASDLFNNRGVFKDLDHTKAVQLIESCAIAVSGHRIPFAYACVDIEKHRRTLCGDAPPIGLAFRDCANSVESWFREHDPNGLGLFVFDKGKNEKLIQNAFRDLRRRVRQMGGSRGTLEHVHDDLYFGDSAYSVGLQAADICTYLVNRHQHQREDTEHLYKLVEETTFSAHMLPVKES